MFFGVFMAILPKKLCYFLLGSLFVALLSGCGKQETSSSKPELAPICPEGFCWIDSIKSCEMIDE